MNVDRAETVILSLATLAEGLPALTSVLGGVLAEAASVCLENQGHEITCRLQKRQEAEDQEFLLERIPITIQMRLAYNDLQEATELGACGVAILVARAMTGYTVIERCAKGTGFDYWLGTVATSDGTLEPLERKARLEVSGILQGNEATIEARAREKIQQTRRSAGELPAYAIVVEFSRPLAYVVTE
jgi:hypothetical protein